MEDSLYVREEDLVKSKSVGCPWEMVHMMSKECIAGKVCILVIVQLTNLARRL